MNHSILFVKHSRKSVCVVLNYSLQSNDDIVDLEGDGGALLNPFLFSCLHTFGDDSGTSLTIRSTPRV